MGDVAAAREVLGRPHAVIGTVVHGEARGRELGFPTANLASDSEGMVPADGVYAGYATVTAQDPSHAGDEPLAGAPATIELARSTDDEKQSQLTRLEAFHARNADKAPAALAALQQAAIDNENVFAKLMDAVRVCSLGQITTALFEVGGQYRRNM